MADKKISQLVDGGVPQATDEFVVDRASADNFKLDWASLKTAAEADAVLDGDAAGGDLTGTYPNPTLAAVGAATGPIGDGTHVAAVTIDTKGRVTGLTSVAITGAAPTGAAGGDLAGTYPNPTLAVIGAATGPIGDATHVAAVTIDTKGRVTTLTAVPITGTPPGGAAGGVLDGTYPNPGLAAGVAGAGLAETLDVLSVNVDNSTLEIPVDTLLVKTGGITGTQLEDIVVAAGPIGDATHVAAVTIDANGRVTALSSVAITGTAPGGAAGGDLSGTYPNPALSTAKQAEIDGKVAKATYDADTILKADSDNTPIALSVGASTFVGRKATGSISAMSATEAAALLTDLVPKSLYDANTVLSADTDNTPAPLTMAASTILARLAAGNIKAATPAELRTLLALVIGTNVQAWDADLDAIAGLAYTAGKFPYFSAAGAAALGDVSSGRAKAQFATGALAESAPPYIFSTNKNIGSNNGLYLAGVYLPAGVTVSSISFLSVSAASSPTKQIYALYDSAYGLLKQTNDDGSTAFGGNAVKTLNLQSTYLVTTGGLYYLAFQYQGGSFTVVAAPQINSASLAVTPLAAAFQSITTIPNTAAPAGQAQLLQAWCS